MGSSRPTDRSIGEATFLPQWMKGKLETSRFDYSENTFSPPADDTFFYIRYPKYHQETSSTSTSTAAAAATNNTTSLTSKLLGFQTSSSSSQDSGPKIIVANKPATVNQQFPSSTETITGGRSIVSVASQIISFGKFSSAESTQEPQPPAPEQRQRKFSKSLPASPLASPTGTPDSSPKSRRRAYNNRFFTGTFAPADEQPSQKNSWLLGSILGQSREIIPKSNHQEHDDDELQETPPPRALSRKKSISSQNLTYVGEQKDLVGLLQAKPSELREMNFWSPTSM